VADARRRLVMCDCPDAICWWLLSLRLAVGCADALPIWARAGLRALEATC
jgi:hypothetical protein